MAVADRTWPSSRGIVDRRGLLAADYGGLWASHLQGGTDLGPAVPCCLSRMRVLKESFEIRRIESPSTDFASANGCRNDSTATLDNYRQF